MQHKMLLPIWLVNSKVWFHLYYKHTKKHKNEMKAIRKGVLRHKREVLGK